MAFPEALRTIIRKKNPSPDSIAASLDSPNRNPVVPHVENINALTSAILERENLGTEITDKTTSPAADTFQSIPEH